MKKYSLILLFLLSISICYSQVQIQGKVLITKTERDAKKSLPFANIISPVPLTKNNFYLYAKM